eukprot:SAG22_NODE_324_length_12373_cov_23.912254_6_plen_71_part_00
MATNSRVGALLEMPKGGKQRGRSGPPRPQKLDLKPKNYAKLHGAPGTKCVAELGSGDSSLHLKVLPDGES